MGPRPPTSPSSGSDSSSGFIVHHQSELPTGFGFGVKHRRNRLPTPRARLMRSHIIPLAWRNVHGISWKVGMDLLSPLSSSVRGALVDPYQPMRPSFDVVGAVIEPPCAL